MNRSHRTPDGRRAPDRHPPTSLGLGIALGVCATLVVWIVVDASTESRSLDRLSAEQPTLAAPDGVERPRLATASTRTGRGSSDQPQSASAPPPEATSESHEERAARLFRSSIVSRTPPERLVEDLALFGQPPTLHVRWTRQLGDRCDELGYERSDVDLVLERYAPMKEAIATLLEERHRIQTEVALEHLADHGSQNLTLSTSAPTSFPRPEADRPVFVSHTAIVGGDSYRRILVYLDQTPAGRAIEFEVGQLVTSYESSVEGALGFGDG